MSDAKTTDAKMTGSNGDHARLAPDRDLPDLVRRVRERTPARLLTGRAGAAYRTETQLDLRAAHAAAKDAVRNEMRLTTLFDPEFIARWQIFEVSTGAATKDEFLAQPDLGRHFNEASRARIAEVCPASCDLQIAIGDGLSVPAIAAQVPALLPLLIEGAQRGGWRVGRSFVIRYCRVGILNGIGEILSPKVVVLLIGERPGLATAESLSAYIAYKPRKGHTDADRNLISNIHACGVPAAEAATRILALVRQMMAAESSGVAIKEEMRKEQMRLGGGGGQDRLG
jgi:ethanolamine ammonia-lyase small subunit